MEGAAAEDGALGAARALLEERFALAEGGGGGGGGGAAAPPLDGDARAEGCVPAAEVALLRAFGPLDGGAMGWTPLALWAALWALRQAVRAAEAAAGGGGASPAAGAALFRDAMLAIAGEGGDADTNGAAAGGLLAAALGEASLPPEWLAALGPRSPSDHARAVAGMAARDAALHAPRGWALREEVPGPQFLAAEVAAFAAGLAADERARELRGGGDAGACS